MAVGMLLKQLRSSGKKYNIGFADMTLEANSRNALLVQLLADEKGLSHQYSNKVYKSFFEDGTNISLKDNVIRVGESVGLDKEDMIRVMKSDDYLQRLEDNFERATKNGIKKFPTFVFDDNQMMVGSPNEKKLKSLLASLSE